MILSINNNYFPRHHFHFHTTLNLRAGRPRGRSSSTCGVKNFRFSTSSRPALGPTQPPVPTGTGGYFPGAKATGAWSWPLTFRADFDYWNQPLNMLIRVCYLRRSWSWTVLLPSDTHRKPHTKQSSINVIKNSIRVPIKKNNQFLDVVHIEICHFIRECITVRRSRWRVRDLPRTQRKAKEDVTQKDASMTSCHLLYNCCHDHEKLPDNAAQCRWMAWD
jgi:hypothetical protein